MTHITDMQTKKALKEALEQGKNLYFEDPSIINPENLWATDIVDGQRIIVTNHPKRSYFATVKRVDGKLRVE